MGFLCTSSSEIILEVATVLPRREINRPSLFLLAAGRGLGKA
jgi:hypothetical protein